MDKAVCQYLAEIGEKGGRKSRRQLSPSQARAMVKVREARRAFKKYHPQCFWAYQPNLKITIDDVPWVGEQLMKNGGRQAWEVGAKLCR